MILRRAAYALALLGALLFHITNDNYLGQFLLALCMALPLLSLALSLPGMAGCRLELAAAPAELDLGEEGRWLVSIQSPNGLPLSRICVRLTGKDLLTGEQQSRKLILSGIARRRPVELAAAAAGADGLIIEVHNDPAHALCDGPQSLTPEAFDGLMKKVEAIRPYADR